MTLRASGSSKVEANGSGLDKAQPASKRPGNKVMIATIGSLLIDLIAFTIILPLLPSILQKYKKTDASGLYAGFQRGAAAIGAVVGAPDNGSEAVLVGGLLGSLFCLLQFISSPIIGAISDTFGRRIALTISLTGICTSHLVWLYAPDFRWFVLARLLGGLFRANVSICTSIIADDSSPEWRPKGMAFIGGAFSIGFTAGPTLGAYFAKTGDFTTPALASFLLSLLSLLLVLAFLPETLAKDQRAKKISLSDISLYINPKNLFNFKAVSTGKDLYPIGLAYFQYIFLYSGLEFTLTFLTHENLKFTPSDQGKMFTFVGVTMTLIQGFLTRRLTNSSEGPAAMFGIFVMIPAFIIIGFCMESFQLYTGLFLYSIGSAIVGPCMTSLAAAHVPRSNENGVAMGIFRSLGSLARSFGPMFSASLFWLFGARTAYILGAIMFLQPLFLLRSSIMLLDQKRASAQAKEK